MVVALLSYPQPHIGKIYHLTGPQSENMHFYAQEYSKALGRTITFQDIPVEPWRAGLLERGLPVHLVNHLATMADLHRAGRYDQKDRKQRNRGTRTAVSLNEWFEHYIAGHDADLPVPYLKGVLQRFK